MDYVEAEAVFAEVGQLAWGVRVIFRLKLKSRLKASLKPTEGFVG